LRMRPDNTVKLRLFLHSKKRESAFSITSLHEIFPRTHADSYNQPCQSPTEATHSFEKYYGVHRDCLNHSL
jgi:hypothetical protein